MKPWRLRLGAVIVAAALGLITLLLGMNSPTAAVAAVFHIINHATFKASLFMAAGIVDPESGSLQPPPPGFK